MTDLLDQLATVGALDASDVVVARVLGRRFEGATAHALVAAAYAMRQVGAGHVCADLSLVAGTTVTAEPSGPEPPATGTWPAVAAMREALEAWSAVATDAFDAEDAALVLTDDHRLYLTRYLAYEERLAAALRARVGGDANPGVGGDDVREVLDELFPDAGPEHDGQRLAAVAAIRGTLAVVVGGPGTGKTTTVVRVLAALVELALRAGQPSPRIVLLAPTGKAGARLAESVRSGVERLPEGTAARRDGRIPSEASTLHRALGFQPADPTRFRYRADNPLPADVVVVDEASMVDVALMTKVVEAVRPGARLILLGDRDQLASVEAGAVLGDIARAGHVLPAYDEGFVASAQAWLHDPPALETAEAPPVRSSIVQLTHSWRFAAGGGIGQLAGALQRGNLEQTWSAFETFDDVTFVDATNRTVRSLLGDHADALVARTSATDPEDALARLLRLQILCAHRTGPWGVSVWNAEAERLLEARGVIRPTATQYHGRPVLVRRNEPTVGLFNGDVGVLHTAGDDLRVWFPSDAGPRALAPGRLPEHETVYAMTIHKSQGSEYEEVVVVLPEHPTPITTRELLYTGVTRAKKRVTVIGSRASVEHAVRTPVRRTSGLADRLWRHR